MTRTLLIDADVVAYQAASSKEVATDWGDNYWTWHVDYGEVKEAALQMIENAKTTLKGDAVKLCLTDSIGNFRRSVLPTYKGNRANVKKPIVLREVKEWMINDLGAYFRPGLEGDDCMGILSTMKGDDERVIVSIDKDMKTIPGKFCRFITGSSTKIVTYSEQEANYWHLYQSLVGDTTDGYSGCPGIGAVKAEQILGPIKDFDVAEAWPKIVEAFEKKGLTEADALVQARVARILRASDYDFNKKEPILWTPPK